MGKGQQKKRVKLSRLTGTAVLRAACNIEHATLGCCEPHARHYGKSRESLHRLTWHTPCVSSSKAVVKRLGGGETGVKGSHSTAIVTVTSKQTQLPRNSTCPWDFRATISSRYPKLECPKWQFWWVKWYLGFISWCMCFAFIFPALF